MVYDTLQYKKLFLMSDKKINFITPLTELGLSHDEALVYTELLRTPNTHLQLSRNTSIARTKVYRIVENLERRSLVARRTDEKGTFLVASDPSTLHIEIDLQERAVKKQRTLLEELVPALAAIQGSHDSDFFIRTYEGEEGLRQMCWHELKAKTDVVALGGGDIEDAIPNRQWAEKHRSRTVEAGYKVRDLINIETDRPTFTSNSEYMKNQYSCRSISKNIIAFDNQTVIYNDTVAIYHHRHQKRAGVEIISKTYAAMMRSIFEHYWAIATPLPNRLSD